MIKKKAMIYPVDRQAVPLFRYNCLVEEYDIIYAVSPRGWGFSGKDCGTIDGGNRLSKIISNDFDSALDGCECVIFMESHITIDFEKMILPKIKKTIEAEKDIVCMLEIPSKYKEEIKNICENKGISFKYYEKEKSFDFKPIDKEYIYDINTPVIGVLGITDRTSKFDIQLAIRQRFIEQGYKVSQIGTRHYSEIMGFHSFPQFMMNASFSESNKIVLFNHYVKKIEIDEKPDVIIIGIPGGAMTYSNKYTNSFGILAFEVCNAIQFDSTVVSTLYNDYKEEYFNAIQQTLRYKLGIDVHAFNLAPLKGDFETLDSLNRFGHLTLSSDFIDNKIKGFNQSSFKICNVLNDSKRYELADYLVDRLAAYSDIEAI